MSGERGPLPSPLPSCQPVLAVKLSISPLHNQSHWKANVSLSLFEAPDSPFFHPSLKVERPSPVSLCGIHLLLRSLLLLVLSGKSQGPIAHIINDYCNSLSPSSAQWQFPCFAIGFCLPETYLKVNLMPLTFSRVAMKLVAMCFKGHMGTSECTCEG